MLDSILTPEKPKENGKGKTVSKFDFSLTPDQGPRHTVSVAVRESLRDGLKEAADAHHLSEHAVARYALRFFVEHFRRGTSHLEEFTTRPERPMAKLCFGDE